MAERLRADLKDQVMHSAYQLALREWSRPQRSLDSFRSFGQRMLHLSRLGKSKRDGEGCFRFQGYGDSLLGLSCRAIRRLLCQQVPSSPTPFAGHGGRAPRLIYQIRRTTLRCDSADRFRSHLHDLLRRNDRGLCRASCHRLFRIIASSGMEDSLGYVPNQESGWPSAIRHDRQPVRRWGIRLRAGRTRTGGARLASLPIRPFWANGTHPL